MPNPRPLSPHHPARDLWDAIQLTLQWRPHTVLEYLLAVAVFGILIAAVVILGVQLHLVHRLL